MEGSRGRECFGNRSSQKPKTRGSIKYESHVINDLRPSKTSAGLLLASAAVPPTQANEAVDWRVRAQFGRVRCAK